MKIYLDTQKSTILNVDSYEEDAGFLFARIGTIVRKIPIDKVAFIEEDMRQKVKPEEPIPSPVFSTALQDKAAQAPRPPMPSGFAAAVDKHMSRPAVGLKPPPGLIEVDRAVPVENAAPMNFTSPRAPISNNETRLLIKVTGAANASIDIVVPRHLADGELEEELVEIIFNNDELMEIISNLAYKKTTKKGHIVEILTEFRKPNLGDPKTVIANQLSTLTSNIGSTVMGGLLPSIPMKDK